MTMITPSYLGETIEYSSLHACRSTLEDPNQKYLACILLLTEGAVHLKPPSVEFWQTGGLDSQVV